MKPADVILVLQGLGCNKIKQQPNGWIACSCPFASTKHSKGRDSHPSFGVSTSTTGGTSGYRCLTCGVHGSLYAMMQDLEAIGLKNTKLRQFVAANERESFDATQRRIEALQKKPAWNAPGVTVRIAGVDIDAPPLELLIQDEDGRTKADITVPEDHLKALSPDFPTNVWQWLTQPKPLPGPSAVNPPRGLAPETVIEWDLRWVPDSQRVAIPMRDVDGRLVGISGRKIHAWQKPPYLHSKGFARDLYLFGEDKAVKGRTGILVEGHFDVMALHQQGFRSAVGVMGSFLSLLQKKKLQAWFTDIVVIPDGDKAGRDAAEQWKKDLQPLPVTIVPMLDGYDPDDLNAFELDCNVKPLMDTLPPKDMRPAPANTVIRPDNDNPIY